MVISSWCDYLFETLPLHARLRLLDPAYVCFLIHPVCIICLYLPIRPFHISYLSRFVSEHGTAPSQSQSDITLFNNWLKKSLHAYTIMVYHIHAKTPFFHMNYTAWMFSACGARLIHWYIHGMGIFLRACMHINQFRFLILPILVPMQINAFLVLHVKRQRK